MKKISAADTLSMSIPERIQLVGDIWDTIAAESDKLELSDEEKRMIDDRLRAYHDNPSAGSSWEDVYDRVTGKK